MQYSNLNSEIDLQMYETATETNKLILASSSVQERVCERRFGLILIARMGQKSMFCQT